MSNHIRRGSRYRFVAALTIVSLRVCSVGFNYFHMRMGDMHARRAVGAELALGKAKAELRKQEALAQLMKSMLGVGLLTTEELESLKHVCSDDLYINQIQSNFERDMQLFDPNVQHESRNYSNLADYLDNEIKKCRRDDAVAMID